jgi:hypothetical protein
MAGYQLAQINIATLKAPLDSPELRDFVDNLDRINALAEQSDGFVWRLKGEGNDATSLRPLGENVIVNMSVWRDAESLRNYVLWWVPAGHRPTVEEAVVRLLHLREHESTPEAFNFGEAFPAPDAPGGAPISFKDSCPA